MLAKKIVMAGVFLLCGAWVWPAVAQQMIILPPDVDYINERKSGDPYDTVFAGLGKNIYFNMKSSVAKFNSLKKSRQNQLHYKALSIVSACSRDNWKIEKFYSRVKPDTKKLQRVCEKHDSQIIIWAEFEPGFKKKIKEATEEETDCFIGIKLSIYENGGPVRSKALALKYKHDFNAFSGKTQTDVSNALIRLLKTIHFDKTDGPEYEYAPDTVQQSIPGVS